MTGSSSGWDEGPHSGATRRVFRFLATGVAAAPQVRLETQRLYLRPPKMRDWRAWGALREESRDFLTPWEPTWPADAVSRAAYMRRLRRLMADWRGDRGYSLVVFDRESDALMGGVSLSAVRRGVGQMASLGYWIGERYARQGYMSEAVAAVTEFAFRYVGLHRVEAACLPNNEPSRRLLLRVGFHEEGYARSYLRIDGDWKDHILFAKIRDEGTAAG